jgi:hypothetical protein
VTTSNKGLKEEKRRSIPTILTKMSLEFLNKKAATSIIEHQAVE